MAYLEQSKASQTYFRNFQQNLHGTSADQHYNLVDEQGKNLLSGQDTSAERICMAVESFLENAGIVRSDVNVHDRSVAIGMESLSDGNWDQTAPSMILDLVEQAGVPKSSQMAAAQTVACLLARWKSCKNDPAMFVTQHYSHGDKSVRAEDIATSNSLVFAPSLMEDVSFNGTIPSFEAWGANTDKMLPDERTTLVVSLMNYNRGILDRIMHRCSSGSPYVQYAVPYAEVYDLLKSYDKDHSVRNDGDHRQNFINLAINPAMVSNELQKIEVLKKNDTAGKYLIDDNIIKPNVRVNMQDLALTDEIGFDHVNYTDLVAENVAIDKVFIKVKKDAKEETFVLNVRNLNDARLLMLPNTNDSGNRGTTLEHTFTLKKGQQTDEGNASEILAVCTDTDYLAVRLSFSVQINLKYADVQGYGFAAFSAYNRDGRDPIAAVQTLAEGITMEIVGYQMDARYSEENLRKTNLAVQTHNRPFFFEISPSRNIVVDYAIDDAKKPDYLMSLVSEAISLGQDHRGVNVIIQTLMHIYDVTTEENKDPNLRERLDKVGFQYPASQLCNPAAYINVIDISNVDSLRSGDLLGDIRSLVEWQLMHHFALMYANSLYKQRLNPGEAPTFKVLTSPVILGLVLAIPHYHNHLNKTEAVDGSNVEYRRVLSDGTILDCVTSCFNYLRDKIIAIPYRVSDDGSVLNFGINWDYGMLVASYTPQMFNAAWKRIFANARTMVIPTNPLGLYFTVKGLNQFVDVYQTVGPNSTTLPDPADYVSPIEGN